MGELALQVWSGGTPSSGNMSYYDGDIPWLRTQDIDFNEVYKTSRNITQLGLDNSSAKWIPENCLIVALYGATAAKVAINRIPLTTNQACCNIQIDPNRADLKFVFYWMSMKYPVLKAQGVGSQSNLNATKVKNFPVPVVPIDEQRRIVKILDNFDALVNDLSSGLPAEINARRKQYKYYRDKLLSFEELK